MGVNGLPNPVQYSVEAVYVFLPIETTGASDFVGHVLKQLWIYYDFLVLLGFMGFHDDLRDFHLLGLRSNLLLHLVSELLLEMIKNALSSRQVFENHRAADAKFLVFPLFRLVSLVLLGSHHAVAF